MKTGLTTRRNVLLASASVVASRGHTQQSHDWPITSAAGAGLRASAVDDALHAGESVSGLRALLVARRGALVAERYYGGASADALLPINSATKSVSSLLVGVALGEGKLSSLDHTVAQLIPEEIAKIPSSAAAGVTLRQILSGRTGLARDWTRWREIEMAKPLTQYALSHPGKPAAEPTAWTYNDAMVSLISPILLRAQGQGLAELATRQLFRPMNIDRHVWRSDRDGHSLAPAGLALRPRDLLKLAAMMVDGGRWRGVQVVPKSWVSESLRTLGPANWAAEPAAEVGYGLLWFTGRLHGHKVAWAWGYGAQFALLAPALELAIATAATSPLPSELEARNNAVMALVARMVEAAM